MAEHHFFRIHDVSDKEMSVTSWELFSHVEVMRGEMFVVVAGIMSITTIVTFWPRCHVRCDKSFA